MTGLSNALARPRIRRASIIGGWFSAPSGLVQREQRLDRLADRGGELERQYGRGHEHAVLDRVDRLAADPDALGQLGLGPAEPRALVTQTIDQALSHRRAPAVRACRNAKAP